MLIEVHECNSVLCRTVHTMTLRSPSSLLWKLYAVSVICLLAVCLPVSDALRIKHLLVPTVIENGTQSTAILDCDYIYDQPPLGLVVKWFFNNQPNPVYQWIPNKRPQDLGVLKGKLNLDYKASDEASKMHRALQIVNPTTDLSGEYRCVVSTFDDEATEAKKMIIFVRERSMELTQVKTPKVDQVTLKCKAEGVYPEPNMTISSHESLDPAPVEVHTLNRDGLYDIEATVTVDEKDLTSPATFDCILRIPETNYTVRKSTIYYTDGSGGSTIWLHPFLLSTSLCLYLSTWL
ncbi:uncharacterized protein isoform X2 [Rhodnius prolixus]